MGAPLPSLSWKHTFKAVLLNRSSITHIQPWQSSTGPLYGKTVTRADFQLSAETKAATTPPGLQPEPADDNMPAAVWQDLGEPIRDAMQSFQWGKTSLPPVLLLLPKCCSFWSIHGGWVLRQQPALAPLLDFGNGSKLLFWESLWATQAGPGDWPSWDHPDHHIFSAAPSTDLACANSQTKPGSCSRGGFVQGLVPGGEKG